MSVQITFEVPEEFHKVLQLCCRSKGWSAEYYIVEELIHGVDLDLQDPHWEDGATGLWPFAGFDWATGYEDQLRALAWPGGRA
jgi:hypothetical protein